MYFLQIKAESAKVIAVQQETAATKLKEENQIIKDEAEADWSMLFLRNTNNSFTARI
jgi:hypothetical protein